MTLASQALALAEDELFFRGEDADDLAGAHKISDADKQKLGKGLLGIAATHWIIRVPHGGKKTYGLATYKAVWEGIKKFKEHSQGPPYALILSPEVFADSNLPLEKDSLVTPSSAIQALLASGSFVMSPGMPDGTGLLASLGKTTLYVGTPPLVEYNAYDGSVYSFTARESIQFFNIDNRSLIKLEFDPLP